MNCPQSLIDTLNGNLHFLGDRLHGLSLVIGHLYQVTVSEVQFVNTTVKGFQAILDLILNVFVAMHEQVHGFIVESFDWMSMSLFAKVHDEISADLFGPGPKVRAHTELIELSPQHHTHILKDIISIRGITNMHENKGVDRLSML